MKLTGAPYVCNGCEEKYTCRKIKYYYYSKFANDEYEEKLRTSRYGINQSKEDIYELLANLKEYLENISSRDLEKIAFVFDTYKNIYVALRK